MKNPIVSVTTEDGIDLYGILLEASKKDAVIINIHGTADNFYANDFVWNIADAAEPLGVSMLSVNNRGAYTLELYGYGPGDKRNTGAASEFFEKCLLDIDAWISYAVSLGYKKIILEGHSLGTEKIVYYMAKGKFADKIKAIMLFGFSDSFGTNMQYLNKSEENIMEEAKNMIKEGKGSQFLSKNWLSHAGILPKNAESYVNFFEGDSELSKAFPIRLGSGLEMYKNIRVPILGVIGDIKEYTVIPVSNAVELLRKENDMAEIHQIKNSDHSFSESGKELASIVEKFLRGTVLK